jgi:hypothetical protein
VLEEAVKLPELILAGGCIDFALALREDAENRGTSFPEPRFCPSVSRLLLFPSEGVRPNRLRVASDGVDVVTWALFFELSRPPAKTPGPKDFRGDRAARFVDAGAWVGAGN